MPAPTSSKIPRVSFKPASAAKTKKPGPGTPKRTLSEKSLNETVDDTSSSQAGRTSKQGGSTMRDECKILRLTIELMDRLEKDNLDVHKFLGDHIDTQTGEMEIFGWSNKRYIPNSFYDKLLTSDSKVKRLMLRGRGCWDSCHCPKKTSMAGKQIDTITSGNTTNLEHLYVMGTFNISACTLLDLIARSPNLKVVRFYGVLTKIEHHETFNSVRFLSELDAIFWPQCSRKHHLPTLKTLVKRHDKISTFYSNADITCDLLASDSLQNLRHLSLILNEDWKCKPGNTQKASKYLKKISYLSMAKDLEALEVRSSDLALDYEDGCETTNASVKRLYENFQLLFWEHVAKIPKLKYLAVFGSWELDKVTRELARHGIQIEYFRTNLISGGMQPNVDNGDPLELSMSASIKHLGKLAKLRSLHYTCHDKLVGIETKTVATLKDLCDLIWVFDIKTLYTQEVEDLLNNMLRRANQLGKGYKIKIHIESNNEKCAHSYLEVHPKFSSTHTVKDRLGQIVSQASKVRYGKSSYKQFHFWGIEQDSSSRERTKFEQMRSAWKFYDEIFYPIEMFV